MKVVALSLVCSTLSFTGCVSVPVTPGSIATVPGRNEERAADLRRWTAAVSLCNAFLASPECKTLPHGQVTLGEAGMEFVTGGVHLPMRVRCTTYGDLLIPFNMIAQERADGFVVGLIAPKQSRVLDNSLFKQPGGQPVANTEMARIILHELTHSWFHLGTVGFFRGVSYYAEAVFLLRYRNHSQERLPFRTDAEFGAFLGSRRRGGGTPAATGPSPGQTPEPNPVRNPG